MKYIITENKVETLIKDYILNNYDVMDVEYTTQNVYLASGPNERGQINITTKVINVYVDNIKHKKRLHEIQEIKSSIWSVLEGLFNIDISQYGSEWNLKVYQVKREEI